MRRRTPTALIAALLLAFIVPITAGCVSDDPEVARAQLAEREQIAEAGIEKLAEVDAVVKALAEQLDQAVAERADAESRAEDLQGELEAAEQAGELDQEQLAAMTRLVEQAQAQARGDDLINALRRELAGWEHARDALDDQVTGYLESVRRQREELEAGTGGLGVGVNLQLAGEGMQRAAQYAPPPAREYGELIGWGLAALGGLLTAGTAKKYAKTRQERDQTRLERDRESQMLDATISSIEAARRAGGDKIDFIDTTTRRVIDSVQTSVPGLKQRIDQVTSKVAA